MENEYWYSGKVNVPADQREQFNADVLEILKQCGIRKTKEILVGNDMYPQYWVSSIGGTYHFCPCSFALQSSFVNLQVGSQFDTPTAKAMGFLRCKYSAGIVIMRGPPPSNRTTRFA